MHVGVLLMLEVDSKQEGLESAELILRDPRWCFDNTSEDQEFSEDAVWDYDYGVQTGWYVSAVDENIEKITRVETGDSVSVLAQKIKEGIYNQHFEVPVGGEEPKIVYLKYWEDFFDFMYDEDTDRMIESPTQEMVLKYIENHPDALIFVGSVHI